MSSDESNDSKASRVLRTISVILRVVGVLIAVLVVVDAFASGAVRVALSGVNGFVSALTPGFLRGLFVFSTPFDGAFRGDFAILAMMFLVADWILCRIATSLR